MSKRKPSSIKGKTLRQILLVAAGQVSQECYSTIPVLCPECLLQGLHWPLSAGWSHFPYNRQILGHLGRFGQASVTFNFNLQLLGVNFLHSIILVLII